MGFEKTDKLISNIRTFIKKTGKSKVVLGLSGGLDSAVTAALLCKAINSENVTCIHLPDLKVTSKSNSEDAKTLAKELGVEYHVVPIDTIKRGYSGLPWAQTKIAEANLVPRIRAAVLYNYANSNNALVAGTGNKSEFFLGYFTKYGDGAVDFFPLGALLKTEVRELAKQLGLPEKIIEKPPSADLWKNQTDEQELGLTYEVTDALLPILLGKKESVVSPEYEVVAEKIRKIIADTAHKRVFAPVIPLV